MLTASSTPFVDIWPPLMIALTNPVVGASGAVSSKSVMLRI